MCRQPEYGHPLHQFLCLALQAVGGGGHFLYQGGVLLGGLVHLRYGIAHLAHALALLAARGSRR